MRMGVSDPVFMQRMCGGGLVDERSAFPPDFDGFRLACSGRRAGLRVYSWNRVAAQEQLGYFLLVDRDRALVRKKWDGRIMLNGIQVVQDAHAAMDGITTVRPLPVTEFLYASWNPVPFVVGACGLMAPLVIFSGRRWTPGR